MLGSGLSSGAGCSLLAGWKITGMGGEGNADGRAEGAPGMKMVGGRVGSFMASGLDCGHEQGTARLGWAGLLWKCV